MRRLAARRLTTTGLLIACCFQGSAQADATSAHVCEHHGLVRLISVEYQRPDSVLPCRVVYEKTNEGITEHPWRARNEPGFCEARASELVRTLREAGWTCRLEEYDDDSSS
ncbi:MAG: hypothetical protein O2780_11780 [Proteobacteria bacterium]|jgi:hypothetical protein|nr:hypothetical protein [Pseudomonadota bacterium]MDA1301117.1 hypothetical protein [Pseudomonadota bacterium]